MIDVTRRHICRTKPKTNGNQVSLRSNRFDNIFALILQCVFISECITYGTDFTIQIGRLMVGNNAGEKTLDECKTICVEDTSTTWRSVVFGKGATFGSCFLSADTALTQPDQCYMSEDDDYITYLRNCA